MERSLRNFSAISFHALGRTVLRIFFAVLRTRTMGSGTSSTGEPMKAVPLSEIQELSLNVLDEGITFADLRLDITYCNPTWHHYVIRARAIIGLVLGVECSLVNPLLIVSLLKQEEFRSWVFFPVIIQV